MGSSEFLGGVNAIWIALGLFAAMLLLHEVGFRSGRALSDKAKKNESNGDRFLDSALSLLLGLLLAFSFSLAAGRYEHRQDLVVAESSAIENACLRCDFIGDDASRGQCRALFKQYLDTRVEIFRAGAEPAKIAQLFAQGERIQKQLWALFAEQARQTPTPVAAQALQSMTEVMNRHGDRVDAYRRHVPGLVTAMVLGLCLVWATFTGYTQGASNIRHPIGWPAFAFLVVLVIYVTFDFDRQKDGFIMLDASRALLDLQTSMR